MNSIDIWWIAVVFWAVGFTISMTRLRFPWAPVSYEVGCVLLIVSAFTDPKIDSPTAGLVTVILGLCMVGIALGWKEMARGRETALKRESCPCGQRCHGKHQEESNAEQEVE